MSAESLRTGSVRSDDFRDPRTALARQKFFSMRPRPLERWLWQQGVPASAERVFWYHWDLGNRNGTWCSQVPIRIVGRDCCLDPATVTRAYQVLKRLELVRRADPGRDPNNPFQQGTAVTEVRVPRSLLVGLEREPNRRPGQSGTARDIAPPDPRENEGRGASPVASPTPSASVAREESREIFGRLSASERARFSEATRHRRAFLAFDEDTALHAIERAHVLATLESLARARPAGASADSSAARTSPSRSKGPRRLAALEIVKLQKSLRTLGSAAGTASPGELMHEILYSVEEGALAKFPAPLAVNVALKKIREGSWTAPRRMPLRWAAQRAVPETCRMAGL